MEPMQKNSNLVSFNEMDKQRHLELSRKGGQRSGEARRRKRAEIEHIRRTDEAMKAQQKENWQTLVDCLKILREAQREEWKNYTATQKDLLTYINYLKEEQQNNGKEDI